MNEPPIAGRRVILVASVGAEAGEELVRVVATAAGMTVYDARLRLKPDLPRVLCACDSIEEAEAKVAALGQLGVVTIVYEQNDLPPREPVQAMGLGRSEAGLRIKSRAAVVDLPKQDIALLVHGKSLLTRETKELRAPRIICPSDIARNLNLALSGGLHISKHETSGQQFLILLPTDPAAAAIQINQDQFDYTCLGDRRGRTKLESLQTLVSVLRKGLPGVPFDDSLLRGQSDNRGEAFYNRQLAGDSSTAMATLIYWRMLAVQAGGHFTFRRAT